MLRLDILFVAVVLCLACAAGHEYEYVDEFELPDGSMIYADKRNCTSPGIMCEDCYTRVFCFQLPNGQWIKDPVDTCPIGQTCRTSDATCISGQNLECDLNIENYKFTCYQIGMFPDAYNCSRYHICTTYPGNNTVDPNPRDYECAKGYGYDPVTTLCRNRVQVPCFADLQPCVTIGQTGAIGKHPSLYYVCLTAELNNTRFLFPQIFHCKDDQLFVGNECRTGKQLAGLADDGTCEGSGDFYAPGDCREYNECPGAGQRPTKKSCIAGSIFKPAIGDCDEITCVF